MGEGRGVYRVLAWKREEKDHSENPGVEWRIILRWIFRKSDVGAWNGSIWLRKQTGGGHLSMRQSDSIKFGEFLD
jgi:hypothetical protein